MINFLKGIAGGIGAVVPGISGAVILVIFNIYEECINAIYELVHFKNTKKNILFLLPVMTGILLSMVVFGRVIRFLLSNFPLPASAAFFGFILGTVPYIFKEADKKGFYKRYRISFFAAFFFGTVLTIVDAKSTFEQLAEINSIQKILMGILMAAGDIVPGVSGTVLLTMSGMYDIYLNALADVQAAFFIPVLPGYILGAVFLIFVMRSLLKSFYGFTYYAIIGFVLGTVPAILRGTFGVDFLTLVSILIAVASFFVSYGFSRLE